MQYRKQSTPELIELLCMAGRNPHPDLIDALWEQRGDAEPILLQLFNEAYDDDWESDDDPRWYRFIHAGKFMLAWQTVDALPTFVRLFSSQDELRQNFCEWFEEDLSYYGPVAIPSLTTIITSRGHGDWHYGRALAGSTLTRIARQCPETRDDIAAIFREQLPSIDAIPDAIDLMWSLWAEELGQLADEASRETVLALDSAKVFSREYFSRLRYLRDLKRGFRSEEAETTFDIRAEYRSGYKSESIQQKRQRIQSRREPQTQMPPARAKIGRNAPCPCGSGKKYKKCHGRPGVRLN